MKVSLLNGVFPAFTACHISSVFLSLWILSPAFLAVTVPIVSLYEVGLARQLQTSTDTHIYTDSQRRELYGPRVRAGIP